MGEFDRRTLILKPNMFLSRKTLSAKGKALRRHSPFCQRAKRKTVLSQKIE